MKLAITILKRLLLPKLEKDAQFDANKITLPFLETLVDALCDFEKDAKPVYSTIYSLQLKDPEKVISKLDAVYHSFIDELAENFVLGYAIDDVNNLSLSKNTTFENRVAYFKNLEKAIKKAERKRIKQELPTYFEKLTFELSETEIANAIKKKSREDLKKKMVNWDEELVEETATPVYSINSNNEKTDSKFISLYWVKYAVAACFVLGFGLWFYDHQNQSDIPENNVVTAPAKETEPAKTEVVTEIPVEAIADVTTVSKSIDVKENIGLGYAEKANKIKVVENHQQARIISINKAIDNYKNFYKDEVSGKAGYGLRMKVMKNRIDSLNNESNQLKSREKQYIFDGKVLILYFSSPSKTNTVLLYDNNYYLKKDTDFYKLTISDKPQNYIKESDTSILKALNKILFDNDN